MKARLSDGAPPSPLEGEASARPAHGEATCGGTPDANQQHRSPDTLARLMTWLSPAFPVGGFSYSHGLEWVVETGKIKDAATLGDLDRGSCWSMAPAAPMRSSWPKPGARSRRATRGCSHEVAELAAAFAPSAERRLETLAQGAAFLDCRDSRLAASGAR